MLPVPGVEFDDVAASAATLASEVIDMVAERIVGSTLRTLLNTIRFPQILVS